MKTKTRSSLKDLSVAGFNTYSTKDQNGDWRPYVVKEQWDSHVLSGNEATITYDDTKRPKTVKTTRKCTHLTIESFPHSYMIEGYTSSAATTRWKQQSCGWKLPKTHLTVPAILSSTHVEALTFFKSGCQTREFDLAVNLLEWEQTLNLFRALKPSLHLLKSFMNSKDRGKFLEYTLAESTAFVKSLKSLTVAKGAANLHLSYQFGIKPLIKDVEGLVKTLLSFEEKIAWLRKNQGKPVRVRFSKDLSTSYAPSSVTELYDYEKFVQYIRHYECKYKAHAVVVYDISKLSDIELTLRVLARAAGVDSALRNAYELMPWSFAIDWVLKVGDFIESIDPTVSLPLKFLDLGWSVSVVEDREHVHYSRYPFNGNTVGVHGAVRRKLYYREPGIPTSFSSLDLGDPGISQLALAVSLFVQKLRK